MGKRKTWTKAVGMPLRLGVTLPPNFWGMGGEAFQQFSRDIIAKDPSVVACDQYGVPGQTDHGVDLRAYLRDEGGLWLAQCKAYERFSPAKIKKVGSDFFKHWDKVWKPQSVKRFTLIVGCDLSNTNQQDELDKQKARFAAHGITFDWWTASTLSTILKPHEEIVLRYCNPLPEAWAAIICGRKLQLRQDDALTDSALMERLRGFEEMASADAARLLEDAILLWKSGGRNEAERLISDLQSNEHRWDTLSAADKSEVLAFEGRLALDTNDLDKASNLAAAAKELAPVLSVSYLRSLIALRKGELAIAKSELDGIESVESSRIRAAIILEDGNAEEAVRYLESVAVVYGALSPELLRIKSLALLRLKRLDESLVAADQAVAQQPTFLAARLMSGILRYFSSLSPTEIPGTIPAWPNPVPWSGVQQNERARQLLTEAAHTFRSIMSEGRLEPAEHMQLQAWLLACLANDLSRQDEGMELCKSLLSADAGNPSAVVWAVVRQYEFDTEASVRALEKAIHEKLATTDHVIALIIIHLQQQDPAAGEEVIDSSEELFRSCSGEKLWRFWKSQIRLIQGDTDAPSKLLADDPDLLIDLAPVMSDAAQYSILSGLSADKLHGKTLLDYCVACAKQADWENVVQYADRLVNEVCTVYALRLATESLFQAHEYQKCLRLLELNISLFNARILPTEFRLLQAECFRRLGAVNDALTNAEQAAAANPNTQTLLHYSQLLAQTGNLGSFVSVVQKLARRPDLTPVQALRLADAISRDDPSTARKLWFKATGQKLRIDQAFDAIALAVRLGLEKEPVCATLHAQLQKFASKKNQKFVRMVSLADVSKAMTERREQSEALFEAYRNGTAPAHILYEIPTLVENWVNNEKLGRPLAVSPVGFCIHEDRQPILTTYDTARRWRINCDLSSLLLAHSFGYLDLLIEKFASFAIPNDTIPILLDARQRLQTMTSEKRGVYEHISNLIERGDVHVQDVHNATQSKQASTEERLDSAYDRLVDTAIKKQGLVLDIFPIRRHSDSPLSESRNAAVIDCVTLARVLVGMNLISDLQLDATIAAVSTFRQSSTTEAVAGQVVLAELATVEKLHELGLLAGTVSAMKLTMTASDVTYMKGELEQDDRASESITALTSLIEKLSTSLQDNLIQLLPSLPNKEAHHDRPFGLSILSTLVELEPKSDDVLLIDDRFANAHFQQGKGMPIVSSFDILYALGPSEMGEHSYFGTLLRLRQANIRYIPLLDEELWFHVRTAITDGRINQTKELSVLRAYVAACSSENFPLKKTRAGNLVAFPFELKRCILECWQRSWTAVDSFEIRAARAEWMISSFFGEPISLALMCSHDAGLEGLALVTSELLLTSWSVLSSLGLQESKSYLFWLERSRVGTLLRTETGLARAVATAIRRNFLPAIDEQGVERPALKALLAWWIENVPTPLHDELLADSALRELLAVESMMTFAEHTVAIDVMERAINQSLAERTPVALPVEGDTQIEISAAYRQTDRISVAITDTDYELDDDELQFLFNHPVARTRVLKNNRWLDARLDIRDALIAQVVYAAPASERARMMDGYLEQSANSFYNRLYWKLRRSERILIQELVPTAIDGLLQHYGFSRQSSLLDDCRAAFFADRDSFCEIISEVPVDLANLSWLEPSLNELTREDLDHITRFLLAHFSPVARIQLLRLFAMLSAPPRAYVRLRRMLYQSITRSDYLDCMDAFLSIQSWAENRMVALPQIRELSDALKLTLIWCHASKLYDIARRAGLSNHHILSAFETAERLDNKILWTEDLPIKADIAGASSLSAKRFVASAASYAFSNEEIAHASDWLAELLLFQADNGEAWPVPELFRLRTNTTNLLRTFLGLGISLRVPDTDPLRVADPDNLIEIATECIASIQTTQNPTIWWMILWYIASEPDAAPSITSKVLELASDIGIEELCSKCQPPHPAILLLSAYCATDPDLRAQVATLLRKVASDFESYRDSEAPESRRNENLYLVLTLAARHLAQGNQAHFVNLVTSLSSLNKEYGAYLSEGLEQLWRNLFLEESRRLWDLRMNLLAA